MNLSRLSDLPDTQVYAIIEMQSMTDSWNENVQVPKITFFEDEEEWKKEIHRAVLEPYNSFRAVIMNPAIVSTHVAVSVIHD